MKNLLAGLAALPLLLFSSQAEAVFPHGSCRGWASIAGWGGPAHAWAEAYLEQQQGSEWTLVETDTTEFWQGEAGEFLLGGRFEGTHPAGTYRVKLLVVYYGNAYCPLTQTERESWPPQDTLPQWDHSFTFTCGSNGPEVTSTPIESAYVGVPYAYDANADGTSCFEGLQGPSGMTIHPTTGLVEWTPQTSDMPRRVGIFRAVNSLGIGDVQGFMVTISNGANLPPQIVSSPPSTGTEGVAYSYQAQSVDAAGDTATWSLLSAPTGMTIGASTGLVSWTPSAGQAGTQAVTVRVTDGGGLYDDQAYSITVTASGNQAPTFVSNPVLVGTEDEPYTYTAQATDDAGPVTYSLSYAPLGMSIDPSSGVVTWLPRNFHVGTISVVVRATDPAGLWTPQPFDIVVSNANGPPRIVTRAPTVASVGVPYSYDVDAVDVDLNDPLTYSLTSAPSGMAIDPATGLITFTPTSPQLGAQTATIRVEDAAGLSDLQTFTVHVRSVGPPTAAFRVAKGRNVSLPADGAAVVSFSSQNGVFVASGALSLSGLSWVADNNPAPYLVVDLVGDQQVIDRVYLRGGATSDGVRDFVVQVSTTTPDPGAFTTIFEGTAPNNDLRTAYDFAPTLARYVRLGITNNHGNTSVTRVMGFEVYSQDTEGGVVSLLEGGATIVSATNNLAEAGQAINFADGAWRTTAGAPQSMVVELSSVGPVDYLRLRGGGNDACNVRGFELWLSATDTAPSSFVLAAAGEVPNDGLEHWLTFPATQARYAELRATSTHGATTCVQVRGLRLYSSGRGGPVVSFDNLSTDPDADGIALYTWRFGDGSQSYERFPTHVYQAPGTYQVELSVTDPGGLSHSEFQSYTVLAPSSADFTWTPLLPLEGSSPQFSDRSTPSAGAVILAHRYSVGGVTYAVPSVSFTLTDNRPLLVELQVTDSNLLTSRRTHQVEVGNVAPSPEAGTDRTVFWGETTAMGTSITEVGFDDRASLQCVWNFGDGQSQTISNCFSTIGVSHSYAQPGFFRARVSVLDKDGGEGSGGVSVQVVRRDLGIVVGPALSESGGNVTVQARLIDRFRPTTTVAGRTLTFRRGAEQTTATTDAAGVATAVLPFVGNTVNVVEVLFAGDGYYNSAEGLGEFGARPFPGVPVQGQPSTVGSRGREFIFAFPPNTDSSTGLGDYRTLTLTTQVRTWATIEAPALSLVAVVEVLPGQPTVYRLPGTVDALYPNVTYPMGAISNRAVRVSAPHEITVHALSDLALATDGFLALPVERLGLEYMAGMGGFDRPPQVTIVATVDGTQVSVASTAGLSPGVSLPNYPQSPPNNFTVTMNRMESLVVYAPPGADLTGTRITATQPVSVLSGMQCAYVPATAGACNHLLEQMPPVTTLGSTFLTVPFSGRAADLFRVIANSDDTEIRIDGVLVATRDRGEFYEFEATSTQYRLVETSLPALFLQFARGRTTDLTSFGDPTMVIVPPVSQFAHNYQVSLEANEVVEWRHFLNIVAPTAALTGLRLDGAPISATWTPIGGSTWSGAAIQVARGTHSVTHTDPLVRYGLTGYGGAHTDAYSYPGEMHLFPHNAPCTPASGSAGDLVDNDCDGQVDEELANGLDDDGDTAVDEDNVYQPTAPNVAPVALAGARSLPEDVAVPVVLNAYDSNNERLTFDLVSTPTHGTLRRYGTGLSAPPEITTLTDVGPVVIYQPDPEFHGTDTFTFQVRDGTLSSNVATVTLTVEDRNDPPEITSTPGDTPSATEEVAYSYTVTVVDADVGDTHSFSLLTAPSGMTVSAAGVITWTPSNAQTGTNKVTVRVADAAGAYDTQNFTVNVANTNDPPTFSSTLPLTATRGVLMVHQVQAADPDRGDVLTFEVTGPAGMQIDAKTGRLEWRPTTEASPVNFTVTLVDRAGTEVSQSRSLTLTNDTTPPQVTLSASPRFVSPGGTVTLTVQASDDIELSSRTLTVDGQAVTLNNSGVGTVALTAVGSHTAVATAVDHANNTRTATVLLGVTDPADTTYPVVDLTDPVDDQEITAPTVVLGTASDANLVERTLSVRRGEVGEFAVIARGTTSVTNGNLGTFDPTLLENGLYTLRLEATDANQQTSRAEITVQVQGGMKVGVFTLSFVDLQIPVSGIPITVTRTYDSRIKSREDFGIGWTLDVAAGRYSHNRAPGEGWELEDPPGVFTLPCSQVNELLTHRTEVRLSDREWYSFAPTVLGAAPTVGGCTAQMGFTQIGGYALGATLEILGNTYVFQGAGDDVLYDDETLLPWAPQQVVLTTYDGRVVELERGRGITALEDLNDNRLTIGLNGISSSTGRSITFTRDAEGRITEITDPLNQSIEYTYNAAGDLVLVTDQANNTTSFSYDDRHNLEDIINPLGVRASRSEYDEAGRLVAVIDADGNRVALEHDVNARVEITRDRLGHATRHEYDLRGNVTRKLDALNGEWLYTYDARDNELTVEDPLGRTTVRTYDANNHVLTVTNEDGDTTVLTRNARGQVTRSEDERGRIIESTYDARGNLTDRVDGEGATVQYTYSAAGNMLTMTDALGNVTTYTYDTFGNQVTATDPLGRVLTSAYDVLGRHTSSSRTRTLPGGGTETLVTSYAYDPLGKPTTTTDPLGLSTTVNYDAIGKPSTVIGKNGATSTFSSDGLGRLSRITYPDGSYDETTYDLEGRVLSETNREGETTTHAYDVLGRRTRTTHPDGSYTERSYDAIGRVLTERDERGNITTHAYGAHTETITNALGQVTVKTMDADDQVVAVTDPLNRVTQFTYDLGSVQHGQGRLVRTDFPNSAFTTVDYDEAGRKIAETDQAGRTTSYSYDALGRLAAVTDALTRTWAYGYDEVGNRRTITDPNGRVTTFEYDALGRMTARVLPLGQRETYAYNPMGLLTAKTDFNGDTTTFTYDVQGRLQSRAYPGLPVQVFTYSPSGRRLTAGGESFTYDDRGRLLSNTKTTGEVLGYTYDAVGNRTSITAPQGTTWYTFDALNRLATVTDVDNGVTTYGYDAAGRPTSVQLPNGVVTTRAYNSVDQLTLIETRNAGNALLASYAYSPAITGHQQQVVEAHSGRTVVYGYDAVYRLVSEAITDPTNGNRTIGYTYDPVGNRMTRSDTVDGAVTYSYDANDRLLTEVTAAGTTTYGYDDNGNTVERDGPDGLVSYAYDPRNLMVAAVVGGVEHGYTFDVDGARTAHLEDGVIAEALLVDRNRAYAQVLRETNATGAEISRHTFGGDEILSSVRGGVASYMTYDAQRSVRQLSTAAGVVVGGYDFAAFGEALATAGPENDYQYSGEAFDQETGLIHLRARQYDPRAGRLVSMDPFSRSGARLGRVPSYLLAGQDPIGRRDPSGLLDIALPSFGFGAHLTVGTIRLHTGKRNPRGNTINGLRHQLIVRDAVVRAENAALKMIGQDVYEKNFDTFGRGGGDPEYVRDGWRKVFRALRNDELAIEENVHQSTAGWAYVRDIGTIKLEPAFFDTPHPGNNPAATMFHEATHAVPGAANKGGHTEDISSPACVFPHPDPRFHHSCYRLSNAASLASVDPAKAVQNADNYVWAASEWGGLGEMGVTP